MMFMNESEIMMYEDRYRSHPVLGPATRTLAALRDLADRNSDGWCYWPKPVRSARKLMELIEAGPDKATEAQYRRSLGPIKAFCTKAKLPFPGEEAR